MNSNSTTSKPLLVYQAPWNWNFIWNRAQPLATALSKYCTVVYLDTGMYIQSRLLRLLTRLPFVSKFFTGDIQWPVIIQEGETLYHCRWLGASTEPWRICSKDWSLIAYSRLKSKLAKMTENHGKIWLLTSRPAAVGLLSLCKWDRVAVDMEDPWLSLHWPDLSRDQMHKLFARADVIFANGRAIASEYEPIAQREIVSLPNGIEDWFLDEMTARPAPVPRAFAPGRRRSVFTGNINDRLDYVLMRSLVESIPGMDFYFVGRDAVDAANRPDWEAMKLLPNMRHITEVPHREVIPFLQHADALLLPYRKMGGDKMFPAKLLEYVAAGKPIATSLVQPPEIETIPSLVTCNSKEDYLKVLNAVVDGQTVLPVNSQEACVRVARQNIWDTRARKFMEVMEKAASPG